MESIPEGIAPINMVLTSLTIVKERVRQFFTVLAGGQRTGEEEIWKGGGKKHDKKLLTK